MFCSQSLLLPGMSRTHVSFGSHGHAGAEDPQHAGAHSHPQLPTTYENVTSERFEKYQKEGEAIVIQLRDIIKKKPQKTISQRELLILVLINGLFSFSCIKHNLLHFSLSFPAPCEIHSQ